VRQRAAGRQAAAGAAGAGAGGGGGAVSLSTSSSHVNLHKLVPSHRGLTHDIIERMPVGAGVGPAGVEEVVMPLPSRWNEADKFAGLELLSDGLEVRFSGIGKPGAHEEAAAVRADHPMPRQSGIYYFEVTVLSKGKEGLVFPVQVSIKFFFVAILLTRNLR
jgi:Ran-binding protein 9/10